jgi:hypothetical protein
MKFTYRKQELARDYANVYFLGFLEDFSEHGTAGFPKGFFAIKDTVAELAAVSYFTTKKNGRAMPQEEDVIRQRVKDLFDITEKAFQKI